MEGSWDLDALVARAARSAPRCGRVRVIAVDGGAAAGKSSLAGALSERLPGSAVLHTDDLLDGWAGQFGFAERLRSSVLLPLSLGAAGHYRRYDWLAGRFAEKVAVPEPDYLIVEGVSALFGCAEYRALGIFVAVPRAERLARWIRRDGPSQPEWLAWLDREDQYFATHPLPSEAVVLAG